MVKSNNICIILIIKALLTILLFFSQGYITYATIALFCIIDLIILALLLKNRWSSSELFTFATLFTSGLFILYYLFIESILSTVLGIGLMLLFLLSALLMYTPEPRVRKRLPELARPVQPEMSESYDIDKFEKEIDRELSEMQKTKSDMAEAGIKSRFDVKQPEQKPLQNSFPIKRDHIEESKNREDAKFRAKALAYELEHEALELKRAEEFVRRKEQESRATELVKEAMELQKAEESIKRKQLASDQAELVRQASILEKAEKSLKQKQIVSKQSELIRQAAALKNAEKSLKQKQIASNRSELIREAAALMKAERSLKQKKVASKPLSIIKEAVELKKADKYLRNKTKDLKKNELKNQAKSLENAEKQIKQLEFLNTQEHIVRQAKDIAKAQKEIDTMNKKNTKAIIATKKAGKKPPASKSNIKIVRTKDESFYFATENGNKYHKPGCLAIKKVPKNKLILYTNKKDAMKKGLQPCSVCIPK